MKKFFTMLMVISAILWNLSAQSPSSFKYQAIARDAAGNILANKLMQCIKKNKLDLKKRIILLSETATQSDYLISGYFEKTGVPAYFPVLPSMGDINNDLPDKKMTKEEILPLIHQKYYKNKLNSYEIN